MVTRRAGLGLAVAATASLAGAALLAWAVIVEPVVSSSARPRFRVPPEISVVTLSRPEARSGRYRASASACFRAPSNSSPGFQLGMFLPSAILTPR